ncbi:MAG: protein kinase domain-containing protein, partial [Pirellulaceae bacterium]
MEEQQSGKPGDRLNATEQWGAAPTDEQLLRLQKTYRSLIEGDRLQWTSYLRLERVLGRGGQGVVFLTRRRGSDDFTLPVAVKFFTPQGYPSMEAYESAMRGVASIAAKVAGIQHDNLIDVQDFIERSRIRIMVSEWIDGFDLERLVEPATLEHCRQTVTPQRWSYINDVIATAGVDSSRLKAGVAVAVVRDCLNGLAALHRERIVHGDIKPANLMLKRTGLAKL